MQKSSEKKEIEQYGLVVSYFGHSVAVEGEDGQVFQCYLRRNQLLPVVGDCVNFKVGRENTGVIINIKPRYSQLVRGDARGHVKPIAANIDLLLIVMAPLPVFSTYLIDRYLIAGELLNISSVIILNKIDLLEDTAKEVANVSLSVYRDLSYAVILSSVYQQKGLQEIADILKGKTAVLVGPSGVGKSSIIAALGGDELIRVAEVSHKGAGKHTTTATRLYHLPGGGNLIDSPGVREFNLWLVSEQDIMRGFREFQVDVQECKFRNCKHLVEPGCVMLQSMNPTRFESYQLLMKKATMK